MKPFPNYIQPDHKDCGPTCLKIIAKYYGKEIPLRKIRELSQTNREGSNLLNLSDAAEEIGFRAIGLRTNFEKLKNEIELPCLVHWNNSHYVVVYRISKEKVYISDPSYGLVEKSVEQFLEGWIGNNSTAYSNEGILLLLSPSKDFYKNEWEKEERQQISFIYRYVIQHKKLFLQLIFGLLGGSLLQLIFPFLTQSVVDIGIQNQDLDFIYLVLGAQLMIFVGSISIEAIRGWILLHLSTRITISLISDFFIKLTKLPIGFFDTRITGDIMQRINDHRRIEQLLTNSSLSTLFSFVNIIIFSFVIAFYDVQIFSIFLFGSALNIIWVFLFLNKRKNIDNNRFSILSKEQSKVIELINGMQEIKLHNAERQKRWDWEYIQATLYKVSLKGLTLEQTQGLGSQFINQFKNIVITVVSATLVVKGEITLGMMLSIQFIIGQLNSPINQIVGFIRSVQDARISLERLNEIHLKEDEETLKDQKVTEIDTDRDIAVKKLSFKYPGADEPVLNNITLTIPSQKITAIVGSSGSGKTTLMKLLMKFYKPTSGEIRLGELNVDHISQCTWRDRCGVVMQEGYIFNDTIAQNIAVNESYIDKAKLGQAVKIANIKEFIETLPKGFNTKIGNEGVGLSTGQKQRILIARAVYKNPDIIFFDEATSALDANNESTVMENLNRFFKGKTVMIIAHRLSTVRNADQIIVLNNGKIAEVGTHRELVMNKGSYYNLVRNQLDFTHLNESTELINN
jgi:ATP-binding cassette subfamily B protein